MFLLGENVKLYIHVPSRRIGMKKLLLIVGVVLVLTTPVFAGGAAEAEDGTVTLTVWHDLGDKGVTWFEEMAAIYQEENPNISIESVTYPTQQWIERSIAALNTNTAPDMIFNNYERVIRVEDQTAKMLDLSDAFADVSDTSFLTEQDLSISRYGGKMLIFPIQRVQMAFGVRESWLENVGMEFPETWEDAIAVAEAFQAGDPDGDGIQGNVYGFALEAANPRDLIHMLDLFQFGTGIKHTIRVTLRSMPTELHSKSKNIMLSIQPILRRPRCSLVLRNQIFPIPILPIDT